MKNMKSCLQHQKGLAAIEVTLTLPVLLILLMSISEIGNMFTQYNNLTKVVQSGSRFAVTQSYGTAGVTCTDITDKLSDIRNVVVYGDIDGGQTSALESMQVSDVSVSCSSSGLVTVAANYSYTPKMAEKIPFTDFSLTFPMSASSINHF
ncbi:TadE/TadG family type IV pilus assembly protein [Vibrio gallaecicus]|uniref:TadE/TadG family type IV pilus assembly protein n=1 Tax=Vibrio gallaecicus TaxID=552386 RepID=A0ABV4N7U6_9VIBR